MNHRVHRRAGTILVCVLACCLTAISLGAAAVQLGLRSVRESQQTLRLRQTQWLLQAGIQRARLQLDDPAYRGEEWWLPLAGKLGSDARIVIVAAPPDNSAGNSSATTSEPSQPFTAWQVTVTAEYGSPAGGELLIRRSHAFTVQHPSHHSE